MDGNFKLLKLSLFPSCCLLKFSNHLSLECRSACTKGIIACQVPLAGADLAAALAVYRIQGHIALPNDFKIIFTSRSPYSLLRVFRADGAILHFSPLFCLSFFCLPFFFCLTFFSAFRFFCLFLPLPTS